MKTVNVKYDEYGKISEISDQSMHFEQENESLTVNADISTEKSVRAYLKSSNGNSDVVQTEFQDNNIYSIVIPYNFMSKGTLYVGFEIYDSNGYAERFEPIKIYIDKFISLNSENTENVYVVTVNVGETTTLLPNQSALVTNSGTEKDVILDFAIPKGEKGDTGATGAKGDKGDKGDTGAKGDKGEPGTTVYTDLTDKPQINGVTLSGNKTSSDLGIVGKFTRYADRSEIFNDYANNTISNGITYAHAEGYNNTIDGTGSYSHVEGYANTVSNTMCHAEGYNNNANGEYSHVEGHSNTGSNYGVHVEGRGNITSNNWQHVGGQYNQVVGNMAVIIGNGSSSERSNAYTLDWNGNGWFAGDVTGKKDNVTHKLSDKANNPTVVTNSVTADEVTMSGLHNRIYRYTASAVSLLEFATPNGAYPADYICEVCFNSGATATTISYTSSGIINWVGTDCSLQTLDGHKYSIFAPTANKRYDIIIYYNGDTFVGLVNGFEKADMSNYVVEE